MFPLSAPHEPYTPAPRHKGALKGLVQTPNAAFNMPSTLQRLLPGNLRSLPLVDEDQMKTKPQTQLPLPPHTQRLQEAPRWPRLDCSAVTVEVKNEGPVKKTNERSLAALLDATFLEPALLVISAATGQ